MKNKQYLSVREEILKYIRRNYLMPGDKLPTYRELAELFGTSTRTIGTALDNLQHRGVLDIRPSSGVFIAGDPSGGNSGDKMAISEYISSKTTLRPADKVLARHEVDMNLSGWVFSTEFGWYDIVKESISAAMKKQVGRNGEYNLYSTYGYLPLRQEVSEYLKFHGINASPDNVLPAGGIYQALLIVATAFFSQNSMCFVPSPSLTDRSVIFRLKGVEKVAVPLDNEGPDLDYIASRIKKRKKAYLIVSPVIHCASGVTMSMQRRRDLYNLCHANRIPIIEIDENREFHPNPLPPLKAIDRHNIVIYIGCLPRSVTVSFDISWIVPSGSIMDELAYTRMGFMEYHNNLAQMAAYEMLNGGRFRKHAALVRQALSERHIWFNALLGEYLGDIAFWDANSCFFYWLHFAGHIDVQAMVKNAEGIVFLDNNYFEFAPKNSIPVCPLQYKKERLEEGIKKLSLLARSCVK